MWAQPQLRGEPITYDVPTPSGLKGMLVSIFAKPEFEWIIKRIWVLKPIQHYTYQWTSLTEGNPYTDDRTLRTATVLVDVDYVFEATIRVNKLRSSRSEHSYLAEIRRRMEKRQERKKPYFGWTEFFADWELVARPETLPPPINLTRQFGSVLWDMVPIDLKKDRFYPVFFNASMEDGCIEVPAALAERYLPAFFQERNRAHPVSTVDAEALDLEGA